VPIVVAVVALVILALLLCAAIVLFVGLHLMAILSVFLAAAVAAAQDG